MGLPPARVEALGLPGRDDDLVVVDAFVVVVVEPGHAAALPVDAGVLVGDDVEVRGVERHAGSLGALAFGPVEVESRVARGAGLDSRVHAPPRGRSTFARATRGCGRGGGISPWPRAPWCHLGGGAA